MRMIIHIWRVCLIAAVLSIVASVVWAMPEPAYFLQDDCILIFGQPNDPLAAGATLGIGWLRTDNYTIIGDPHLIHWGNSEVAAGFSLKMTASSAPVVDNGIATLTFDSGEFQINSAGDGTGTNLWTGSVHSFAIQYHSDLSTGFPTTGYSRSVNAEVPNSYLCIGGGSFDRTGGDWNDPVDQQLTMKWIGMYNCNFDDDGIYTYGNIQGQLVPEPGSAAALLCGLAGLSGVVIKRRKS